MMHYSFGTDLMPYTCFNGNINAKSAEHSADFAGCNTLFAVIFFVGCNMLLDSMCSNQVISQAKSPGGSFVAVVFQRDCGATTGFSSQVSLHRTWLPRGNSSGNVFVSDTNLGEAPSGIGGGPEVNLKWQSANELIISHHAKARTFLTEPQWGSVKINYENIKY
jgi:hypothetical protein